MGLSEAETRLRLIDPAIRARGWTEDLIKREEALGAVEIVDGKPRRASRGRTDYTLRIKVAPDTQPVAVEIIEAKAEDEPPTHGREQIKGYQAATKRLHVPFVYATNGHLFVEYDRPTGLTTQPALPIADFPTPQELPTRYEYANGISLDAGPPSRAWPLSFSCAHAVTLSRREDR